MTDPIRSECPRCGDLYFASSQDTDCPHRFTTSFTKGLAAAVRELLAKENAHSDR